MSGNPPKPTSGPAQAALPASWAPSQLLLAGGLTVTSTATAALNGVYAVNGSALEALNAEVGAILLNNTAADGSEAINWPDWNGTGHNFTLVQFRTLAAAIYGFVAACYLYGRGITTNAPATTATIP